MSAVNWKIEGGNDEPGGEGEPSLGALEQVNQTKSWAGSTDQRMVDREQDDSDDEPSLGSLAVSEHGTQAYWGCSSRTDVEDQQDDEYSLCGVTVEAGTATSKARSRKTSRRWAGRSASGR
jgi:hypothetical protein